MRQRRYPHTNLDTPSFDSHDLKDELVKAARYLIVRTLVEKGVANVDPLSAENPLISVGLNLYQAADNWISIAKDGSVNFDSAAAFIGKGNFAMAKQLHEKYSRKVNLIVCGTVGEYCGLLAGIAMSDTDRRPARLALVP